MFSVGLSQEFPDEISLGPLSWCHDKESGKRYHNYLTTVRKEEKHAFNDLHWGQYVICVPVSLSNILDIQLHRLTN